MAAIKLKKGVKTLIATVGKPTIKLTPVTTVKKTGIAAYREKKTVGGKIVKAATSLKTTAVLGTVLGLVAAPAKVAGAGLTLVKSAIPKSLGGKLAGVTLVSAAAVSPTVREFFKRKANPVKAGISLGKFIEGTAKPYATTALSGSKSAGQLIKEGLLAAGVVGGGIAAGTAAVAAGKKIYRKIITREKTIESALPSVSTKLTTPAAVVDAPAFTGGEPTAPAALQIPSESPPAATSQPKPIKVSQKVNVEVHHIANKRYLNHAYVVSTR